MSLKTHFATLARSIEKWPIELESVHAIRDAVVAGASLDGHLDEALENWRLSNQTTVGEPLALAIVVHHLRVGDVGPLQDLIASERFAYEAFNGMRDAVELGIDVEPLLPMLFANLQDGSGSSSPEVVIRLWLKADPEHAGRLTELIRGGVLPMGPVPSMATDLALFEHDIGGLIGILGQCLSHPKRRVRERASWALKLACQKGTEVQPAVQAMSEVVANGQGDESRNCSYVLFTTRWPKGVRPLLAHDSVEVRQGAAAALGFGLLRRRRGVQARSLMWRCLLDADQSVRQIATRVLAEVREKGQTLRPDAATLRLMAASDAALVEPWLAELARQHEDLVDLLGPATTAACSICRQIKRYRHYGYASDIPDVWNRIEWDKGLGRCPECGNAYTYREEIETEMYSRWEDYWLERPSPAAILRISRKGVYAKYEKDLPKLLERYQRELDHQEEWARRDAGHFLAEWYLSRQEIDRVRQLLTHARPGVQEEAMAVLRPGKVPGQLLPTVKAMVKHPSASIRRAVGGILAKARAPKINKWEQRMQLLDTHDAAVLNGALQDFPAKGWPAKIPVIPRLIELLEHPDETVQRAVVAALRAFLLQGQTSMVQPAMDLLNHAEDAPRGFAAKLLLTAVDEGIDISQVHGRLGQMVVERQSEYYANEVLERLLRHGRELGDAWPWILEIYGDKVKSGYLQAWMYRIDEAIALAPDTETMLLLAVEQLAGSYASYAASALRDAAVERDLDLSGVIDFIAHERLTHSDEAIREMMATCLVRQLHREKDWEALAALLQERLPRTVHPVVDALEELDCRPLYGDLAKLAHIKATWLNEGVMILFRKQAEHDNRVAAVRAALDLAKSTDAVVKMRKHLDKRLGR